MSANGKQKNSRRAARIRFEAGWFPACISEFVQRAHPFTANFLFAVREAFASLHHLFVLARPGPAELVYILFVASYARAERSHSFGSMVSWKQSADPLIFSEA
jgi:hypothetical protein